MHSLQLARYIIFGCAEKGQSAVRDSDFLSARHHSEAFQDLKN